MVELKDIATTFRSKNADPFITTCDIFINNMKMGVPERLGLGYDDVRKVRPDIIYCKAGGYGSSGLWADRGAVDPRIQATSGWTSLNGKPGGRGQLRRRHRRRRGGLFLRQVLLEVIHSDCSRTCGQRRAHLCGRDRPDRGYRGRGTGPGAFF